jgi:hypothetical protein
MTQAEMEQLLENVDGRLARVEQILPTLATKRDLDRFATKEDLQRYATKEDLEPLATKVAVESLQDDVRIVLDAVVSLIAKVDQNSEAIRSLSERFDARP